MLAVNNAADAAAWYKQALGATELWNFGSVVGLAIDSAPFFCTSRRTISRGLAPRSRRARPDA
jgi:hypothetical protein